MIVLVGTIYAIKIMLYFFGRASNYEAKKKKTTHLHIKSIRTIAERDVDLVGRES